MEHTLEITAELSLAREATKGVIWTIFFTRLFGRINPINTEFLDVSYSKADNVPELEELINAKVQELFHHSLDRLDQAHFGMGTGGGPIDHREPRKDPPANITSGRIIIQFSDKLPQQKKKTGWFGKPEQEETNVWESWVINVTCVPSNPANGKHIETARSFEECLFKIFDLVDSDKERIPQISSLDTSPFPYTITVDEQAPNTNEGWGKKYFSI